MKLEVTKKKDNRVEFTVSGIDESMANAVRRTAISDIPVMAIESVTFYQNSSVMDDEVLAHRLGLIPLKTDPAGPDKIELTLKAAGPGTVYSKELQVKEAKAKGKAKKADDISVYETVPIMKLGENQTLEFEAAAQLGTGRQHIKWQGGIASYESKGDKSFDFFIESYGQMPIDVFVDQVFEVFGEKIKKLKSLID